MKYFAYGENMFSPKLYDIAGDAICLGIGKIMGYRLFFHNRGHEDPSGKCNIMPVKNPNYEVYGVLYEIAQNEKCLLDKAHGLGSANQEITLKVTPVTIQDNKALITTEPGIFAVTYIADRENVFEDLVPFSWYKDMIVTGAKEHQLPLEYIHHLEQYACTQDPNVQRANKQKRYLESMLS